MQDKDDLVPEVELVPEREQVLALFGVAVAVWPGGRELVAVAHADQVAGD
jgi:hypothetical protein